MVRILSCCYSFYPWTSKDSVKLARSAKGQPLLKVPVYMWKQIHGQQQEQLRSKASKLTVSHALFTQTHGFFTHFSRVFHARSQYLFLPWVLAHRYHTTHTMSYQSSKCRFNWHVAKVQAKLACGRSGYISPGSTYYTYFSSNSKGARAFSGGCGVAGCLATILGVMWGSNAMVCHGDTTGSGGVALLSYHYDYDYHCDYH